MVTMKEGMSVCILFHSLSTSGSTASTQPCEVCENSSRRCRIALCILSCLVASIALSLMTCELLFDTIEGTIIGKKLVITENSSSFQILTTDFSSTLQFYLFNLTNAEEWQRNGTKPRLRTVGPYVYRRITKKKGVRFSEDRCGRRVLEYSLSTAYYFERNGSIGDPGQDRLLVPNFVERIATSMISQAGSTTTQWLWILTPNPLLMNLTAEEIMWGHEYQSLSTAKVFGMVKDTKIGLFNRLNNTLYGPYQINTGAHDISKLGALVAFEGKINLDKWGSVYANMLNGSADAITPPSVKIGVRRHMFSSDLCRSVSFIAKKWVSASNYPRLKLLALEMEEKIFVSADEEPENVAFHPKVYPTNQYPPTGLLSLSPCVDFGIAGDEPLFISLPYFNQATVEVKEAVDFEGPTEPNLTSHLHIDPKTGILIEGELVYQINVFLAKKIQKTPKDIYFPLVYVKDITRAGGESAQQLHQMAYEFPAVIHRTLQALVGVFEILAVLLLIPVLILYRREYRHLRAQFEEECSEEKTLS
ncbi:CD36 class B scavenger receptor [Echinococcus multilocularis]|uniref:CD36 class B scavenger receptor n=1 Tax=Echinococcus multilocularis TaxID=6211 RepID=A0A068Y9Y7_ECHMU|nr:CD36 class B scavenger receptor [Echinococcus multilocularis]